MNADQKLAVLIETPAYIADYQRVVEHIAHIAQSIAFNDEKRDLCEKMEELRDEAIERFEEDWGVSWYDAQRWWWKSSNETEG